MSESIAESVREEMRKDDRLICDHWSCEKPITFGLCGYCSDHAGKLFE